MKKNTKRSLLLSVLALILCCALLAGTTLAWFTDTASTAVNKIVSGNLDVALEMSTDGTNWESAEGKTLTFKTADNRAADKILWEPGCTYELPKLRVVNKGNLALKYKIQITGIKGSAKLNEAIEWTIDGITPGNTFTSLAADANSEFTIKGHMQETAGNDYQGLTIDGIGITVYATQDTVENDSFNNQYDQNAPSVYPAGVTDDIFDSKIEADYSIPGGTTGKAQAVAAYVDSNGDVQYTADVKTALDNGASTIYLKKGAAGRLMALSDFLAQPNRTSEITKDITIYANGADFGYGELAINTSEAGKNANFTIKVYDAKNLRVWGNTPNAGVTQNIILENCTFEGKGINSGDGIASGGIFFAYGATGTINLTMNNCKVSGSDQGVYFGCDGGLTVKDSSFTECATGIKVSYKGNGTRTDRIENCVFTKCGCTTEMAGSTTYLADDSAAIKYKKSDTSTGTITLTLKSNTISGTIGDKGDTQFIGVTPVYEGP